MSDEIKEIDRLFCEAYSHACTSWDYGVATEQMHDAFSQLLRLYRKSTSESLCSDDCRKEFEKWMMIDSDGDVIARSKSKPDEYEWETISDMWTGWQGAWSWRR